MKKIVLVFVLISGSQLFSHDSITVSIMNKSGASLMVQVENEPGSLQSIDPEATGFIRINPSDPRKIILTQTYKTDLGTFSRSGVIQTLNITNYSFMVSIDQANNLLAVPTGAWIRPNIKGPGIKGRF